MSEALDQCFCLSSSKNGTDVIDDDEDIRISKLREISYGFVMPTICILGIVGNGLNLVVLTRRHAQGTAYIYMRAYSLASLVAVSFCIPFALRVLIDKEKGSWNNWFQAFYHVHLELYLSNSCLGVCVMALLALTVERYTNVCCLRPASNLASSIDKSFDRVISPRSTLLLLTVGTFFLYLPTIFRAEIISCLSVEPVERLYQQRDNQSLLRSTFYQVYRVMLELIFKIGPTLLLAALNLLIVLAYRRACNKRCLRRPSSSASYLAEERRLIFLLGSTSVLFLVCVSPMVFLNLTLSQDKLAHFSYQLFRALANLLEVTNYSLTFYIYCLFSEDFRSTLRRTFLTTSSSVVVSV